MFVEYSNGDAYLGAVYTILVEMPAFFICNHTFYDKIILYDLDLKIQHYKETADYARISYVVIKAMGIRYY